jgi:asparagine synthase (glutamine-hydrolysing)
MNRYLGGIRFREAACVGDGDWRASGPEQDLFLEVQGDAVAVHQEEDFALLTRGIVRWGDRGLANLAAELLQHYRQTGALPSEQLEGSFTLILLDARQRKVILYRNLVGNGFTYYTRTPDGFLFGSNLAELVERRGHAPQANADAWPAFFLFRFVPGRDTLFRDCYRLLPGEELTFDEQGLRRRQRQTFADLRGSLPRREPPLDQLERTMSAVLQDQQARRPDTVNLLSGGVDSTYLQAVWQRVSGQPGRSFSVSVNHPRTRLDTDYALSAAAALQTRHTLLPADGKYVDYLSESLASTGEPPNHVFAVYLGALARAITSTGIGAALCGEGADSLFGIGSADGLRHAQWIRRLVPGWLRGCGARAAQGCGRPYLADAFRLAGFLRQPRHWDHPLNRVAVFADWDLVQACFGDDRIDRALAERRELLDLCQVGEQPLDRLHAIGYLGEAADSASLWTTLFNQAGGDLYCPFLDSRLLRLAVNLPHGIRFPYRRPKGLLKDALARHVPRDIVERVKLGFGQPIVEWLGPGGQLQPYVKRIGHYDFLPAAVRTSALARPGWFLYSLLCFDLWHKIFIERTLRVAGPGMQSHEPQPVTIGA